MGIASRFANIMSANINDFLDGLEAKNAEKMIDQELRKSRERLAQVKDATSEVMANETARKRDLDACDAEIKKYADAAVNAVKAGSDEDARKLLQRKQNLQAKRAGLQEAYDAAHQDSVDLQAVYNKLVDDITALESRADVLKGKLASAKAREGINKVATAARAAVDTSAFGRMEQNVNKRLDKANAVSQLNVQQGATEDLVDKYATPSTGSVDDELAALKAQLGQQ